MKTLLVGYKAADIRPGSLEGDVTWHTLDIYHAHAVEKVHEGVKVVCSPHLPEGDWDLVRFRTGPALMSGELALDLMQEIHRLGHKRFELDFIGRRERDRNDLLNKIKNDPKRVRSFKAEWSASVPGGKKLMFTSYPGCFCHRRLDEGGLALAEVVSRDFKHDEPCNSTIRKIDNSKNNKLRLLDMGCGCGLVGFLIASVVPDVELTMIDSHTRAVEAARENALKFGVDADVILSDDGLDSSPGAEPFDVFVGNPPYYSDYRIAEVFFETAKKNLKPGGLCYTVVKNAEGLKSVQEKYFDAVEIIPRRGYAVLKSVSHSSTS